jgi:uncharacterized YccA/Bax inhibitor family protein
LFITALVMLAMSFAAGRLWTSTLGFAMPSYLAGVIGGVSALPIWELLKRWGKGAR